MDADQQSKSLLLSEVLDYIGVNESTVRKTRRSALFYETFGNIGAKLSSCPLIHYCAGSNIEGTTTVQLNSDFDVLDFCPYVIVIQEISNLERDKINFLMIQDETVSPGYCYLHVLGLELPIYLRQQFLPWGFYTDSKGRTFFDNITFKQPCSSEVLHGPAMSGNAPSVDYDFVRAIRCNSWPPQARQWLSRRSEGSWPSEELKRSCGQMDCLVVPVGCKGSRYEQLEWRISTTLAERCLMFDLNITQIRCYVLMKMILKTYIKPKFEDAISSYMCKTILFHRIASTDPGVWNERRLLSCLQSCLFKLHSCIKNENCPHFIIQDNNLMHRRFSTIEIKDALLEKVFWLYTNLYTALLGIQLDLLGNFLLKKTKNPSLPLPKDNFHNIECQRILGDVIVFSTIMHRLLVTTKSDQYNQVLCYLLIAKIHSERCVSSTSKLETAAYTLLIQQFSSLMGSTLASAGIQRDNAIPCSALKWMEYGFDTDVSSSRLKYASMFYCTGDMKTTEKVITKTQDLLKRNKIYFLCKCEPNIELNIDRSKYFYEKHVNDNLVNCIKHKIAFCVKFLPFESNCVPHELRYEMFRSTQEDLAFRGEKDYWMDWAVVDSITYLYYLQYKTYAYLGRQEEKLKALKNLERTIATAVYIRHRGTALSLLFQFLEHGRPFDALRYYHARKASGNLDQRNTKLDLIFQCLEDGRPSDALRYYHQLKKELNPGGRETARNLSFQCSEPESPLDDLKYYVLDQIAVHLGHKETALNLLGQCLEQEGRPLDALRCYCSSLKVRERNNAANIHICRLISTLINKKRCKETIYERVKK